MPSKRGGQLDLKFIATRADMRQWAEALNLMVEAINENRLNDGVGIELNRTSNGTIPNIRKNIGAAAASTFAPFQMISFIGTTSDGTTTYALTLQPGDVNGNIFPKVSSTYMWQLVGTTVGGVTTYAFPTLTVNKGDQVYLQGTVTAGVLSDVNIYSGTPPDEDDSTTILVIGTCDSSTGAWTQIQTGNLEYTPSVAYFSAGSRLILHTWAVMAGA